jgi:hypothetical protein
VEEVVKLKGIIHDREQELTVRVDGGRVKAEIDGMLKCMSAA